MPIVDWTISLGNILTLAGFVGGGFLFAFAVRRDVDVLSIRLEPLEKAVLKLTDVMVDLARQDERLEALERHVERHNTREQWRKSEPR